MVQQWAVGEDSDTFYDVLLFRQYSHTLWRNKYTLVVSVSIASVELMGAFPKTLSDVAKKGFHLQRYPIM